MISGFAVNYPVLAIMTLFLGAFLTGLAGRRNVLLRNLVVTIAVTIPLLLMLALIKPVFAEGKILSYWMGGWEPVAGWAIGIGLEVDALSLFFGLIVTVAVFVSGIYSFTYMNRDDSLVNYYTLFLMLAGSVLGLVLTGDLFNIFVMIEIMTLTAVALTAFRVDYDGALEGAMKYLVVGSVGSTVILMGIAMLYSQLHTLNLAQIAAMLPSAQNSVTVMAFAFLFIGFGTKAFLFPFHPLAADAHAVAPASISLMISGVLTKCGVYGIIRLCYTMYQNADLPFVQYLVTGFGAISCFVCVTMAFNQHNFKRLLAFHSISQVGYVITAVGLGSMLGLEAGLYHAMNHTIFKGLLFLTAGAVQHETGSLDLDRLGGLSKRMPHTCALFLIGAASISGLPPFNGFSSKWMIYQAAFERGARDNNIFFIIVCVIALLSSVLTLASFIKVTQSVFFGQLNPAFRRTKEAPLAMRIPMIILAVLCVVTGLFPKALQRIFLQPAAAAAWNVTNYIDRMLGDGYAAAHGIAPSVVPEVQLIGNWNPVAWLWLLLIVTCAVCIVAVMASPEKNFRLSDSDLDLKADYSAAPGSARSATAGSAPSGAVSASADATAIGAADAAVPPQITPEILAQMKAKAKYEPFFSGEESRYSQVGGSDLFWGFKHNWRKYFSFMGEWHSGIVNDYTRYGSVAIAIVLLLCVLFL